MDDDGALVDEFQRTKSAAAFDRLVERHRRSVFRLVCSLLGPGRVGEAEEVAQDVFVKVYLKLDGFRGESKFSSWLYRIAFNEATSHRRRTRWRSLEEPEEVLEMTPAERPRDDPFRVTTRSLDRETLGRAIAALPDVYRSVLHLHYWLGMTVAEVAGVLAVPDGTVKSYLHRARAKLARKLRRRGAFDG